MSSDTANIPQMQDTPAILRSYEQASVSQVKTKAKSAIFNMAILYLLISNQTKGSTNVGDYMKATSG
ncbi:hypothetical protein O9992_24160 [Vibrio lentus]|nr:hypothetical protein [Vibrio lentus]